jgi:hypothetical protein
LLTNGSLPWKGILVILVVICSVGVGAIAVCWLPRRLPPAFQYDLGDFKKTDPALILYRQTSEVSLSFQEARAIAVGLEDRIFVAGDQSIAVFDPSGVQLQALRLEDEPQAVAIGLSDHVHPGRVYVALKNRVEVRDPAGMRLASWTEQGPKAWLTSIAVGEQDILVADAGRRLIYRFDTTGKLLGQINGRDDATDQEGFIVPSPYFHLALSGDGLVRVVNPGKHRIEAYTLDGHREALWGQAGTSVEAFCGCCNPASFAILPDGGFVTAEKGLPRVKVYSARGEFRGVVVGTETLAPQLTKVEETRDAYRHPVVDVAADSRGRVLVLDPQPPALGGGEGRGREKAGKVRIFELK